MDCSYFFVTTNLLVQQLWVIFEWQFSHDFPVIFNWSVGITVNGLHSKNWCTTLTRGKSILATETCLIYRPLVSYSASSLEEPFFFYFANFFFISE